MGYKDQKDSPERIRLARDLQQGGLPHTFPNICRGKPIYDNKELLSLVFKLVGLTKCFS
jgi:hypothetical protein